VPILFAMGKVQVKKGLSLSTDWLIRGDRTDLISRQGMSSVGRLCTFDTGLSLLDLYYVETLALQMVGIVELGIFP